MSTPPNTCRPGCPSEAFPANPSDLARQFGRDDNDKLILDRKGLSGLLGELRALKRKVIKALDKGGVVVVEANGALITAYNTDSYDRRRIHGR